MDVVILSAVRTPIGKFEGNFVGVSAQELGATSISAAVERSNVDKQQIDEVIMGNVISAGLGQNVARQCAIYAGLPVEIPAVTVNKVCGSGMKSVMIGASEIKGGDAEIVVAGGTENMNRAPYILENARFGYRLFDNKLVDAMVYDGLWDVYNNFHMGMTGEIIAEKYNVTREDADKFALRSHKHALNAIKDGKFKDEIVPVEVKKKKEIIIIDTDEGPRADTSLEKLAKLKPVFKSDGIITAGNASQISDGAAAMVISSADKAREMGIRPLAKIMGYTSVGVKPEYVMEAPIPAIRKLLDITNLKIDDIDLFEHNEAFATASVAVSRELNIPDEKFNVNGGAVALGHPIGCSGARILVTLLHEMIKRDVHRGLATACLGGGNAVAMIIER
jgi:acetyl-CoA C-acetyltransferase